MDIYEICALLLCIGWGYVILKGLLIVWRASMMRNADTQPQEPITNNFYINRGSVLPDDEEDEEEEYYSSSDDGEDEWEQDTPIIEPTYDHDFVETRPGRWEMKQ